MPILFICLISVFTLHAQEILEKGTSSLKDQDNLPWFTIKKIKHSNSIEVLVEDSQGKAMSQESITLNGDQFSDYQWRQAQTKESVELKLRGDELSFSYKETPESEVKSKKMELTKEELEKLILPPLLTDELVRRLKKEPKSKMFQVLVIVPDKRMTLNFNFIKKSENTEGQHWKLEPDSFFVGLIVGPVDIYLTKDLRLKKIKDIMLPVKMVEKSGRLSTHKTDITFD